MTQPDKYSQARGRAVAKYAFFVHAGVYAAVMALLVIINLVTSPAALWFIWPLIGWGFAVALHGLAVFLLTDRNAVLDALTQHELRRLNAEDEAVADNGRQA
ncbi:MAG: 2TM domain-containing protein [Pseudomonadota bacterium]